MSELASQLKRIRQTQGHLQADIARELGITATHLSEIEAGHRSNPDRALARLRQIAAVYGYDIVIEIKERPS